MAPELLHLHIDTGQHGTVNQKQDAYSIGVLFYELLTGRQPWWAGDEGRMLEADLVKAYRVIHINRVRNALPRFLC